MTMKRKLSISVALLIGIVVMVNLLAYEFRFRLDFTEGRQYTLSKATRDILADLDEPVTVRAYFSENPPAHIQKARKDFQDMLVEFASRSRGRVMFEFINPNADEATEQEVGQKGIRPVMINVREKDQMKQQRAYLGATIDYGEKQEVIPFIQPGAAMEYALATSIKKLRSTKNLRSGSCRGTVRPVSMKWPSLTNNCRSCMSRNRWRLAIRWAYQPTSARWWWCDQPTVSRRTTWPSWIPSSAGAAD